MNNIIKVEKRNGKKEDLDLEKYHEMVNLTVEGLNNCSVSSIELKASPQFYDGIKSSDIHKMTTKATADLISLKSPNYQYAAARSLLTELRKEVWGSWKPQHLKETLNRNIELKLYDDFYKYYTEDEINFFNSKIKHDRDLNFSYCGLSTVIDKFAVKIKNNNSIKVLETPQELNMLVSMYAFRDDPNRDQYIVDYYNKLSLFEISLPSPLMSGLRTPIKGFASCCLIDTDDTRDSLVAANGAISTMTSFKAGIGEHKGFIRGIGASVKNGTIIHNGITSILKWSEAAVKWASQGSRGGSSTSYHAYWNWEIEKILTLKSNKSTPENSVKKLDYGIGLNKLLFDRALEGKDITLFSSEESKELYTTLNDYDKWVQAYLDLEKKPNIRKKKISARYLLSLFAKERFETGRYYPLFLDNANKGPLKPSIYMSNLCAEILLNVKPLRYLEDPEGEIALCILSNVNAAKITGIEDLENITRLLVRSLDNIIDIQEYPLPAARNSTMNARYLGIGVSDWAHYLSKKKVKYDTQESLDLAEEFMENLQFYLLKASCELSKERGEAPWFRERSKYADGYLPNDGKQRFIPKEKWNELRKDIMKHGLRNLTLSAIPPAGTSSDVSDSTSGLDFPRDFMVSKKSSVGSANQIIPNFSKGSSYYTLVSELDNLKYIELISKFQLYVDQSISSNVYWSSKDFTKDKNGNSKFPIKKMIDSLYLAHKLGLKTQYYSTFLDNLEEQDDCESGACKV